MSRFRAGSRYGTRVEVEGVDSQYAAYVEARDFNGDGGGVSARKYLTSDEARMMGEILIKLADEAEVEGNG